MGERKLPLPSFGVASKGQGGQGPLPPSLFHFLIWESNTQRTDFHGEEPLGALDSGCPWGSLSSRGRPESVAGSDQGQAAREKGGGEWL